MLHGIGSGSAESSARLSKMISSLDTNNDGKINRSEFVAGKPSDVSSDDAGTLFDTLDSGKTGAMSQNDLLSAFQQMGGPMQSALIQAQSDSSGGGHDGPPDAGEMFSKLDSDGDGKVSKAEFTAGKPSDVSTDQAAAFFDKISNGNGDSLTKDQFVSGFKTAGPPDRADASSSSGSSSSTDPGQLLDQLLSALSSSGSASAASNTATSSTDGLTTAQTDAAQLLDQFIRAVGSYQNTAHQSRHNATAPDVAALLGNSVAA